MCLRPVANFVRAYPGFLIIKEESRSISKHPWQDASPSQVPLGNKTPVPICTLGLERQCEGSVFLKEQKVTTWRGSDPGYSIPNPAR